MKRLVAVVLLVMAANVVYAYGERVERKPLVPQEDAIDDPRPWLMGSSVDLRQTLGPLLRPGCAERRDCTMQGLSLRFHAITNIAFVSNAGGGRPARNLSDQTFLLEHPRYANGAFTVKLWRARGESFCVTQSFTVPATAGQDVGVDVDLTQYRDGDSLLFEIWPGYDVGLEMFVNSGWREIARTGAGPGGLLETGKPHFGREQVPTGTCP